MTDKRSDSLASFVFGGGGLAGTVLFQGLENYDLGGCWLLGLGPGIIVGLIGMYFPRSMKLETIIEVLKRDERIRAKFPSLGPKDRAALISAVMQKQTRKDSKTLEAAADAAVAPSSND